MKAICSPAYVNYATEQFDYKAFADSELYAEMVLVSGQLRNFNLSVMSDLRPLFVNIYNMMIIQVRFFLFELHFLMPSQALLIRGCAETEFARSSFLSQDLYYIGPLKFSAIDIRHLLLNQPDLIPDYKYYLRQYTCKNADPRVLFFLHNGILK